MTSGETRDTAAAREAERISDAEALARHLDRPMGILGVIFVFIVLGQLLAENPVLITVLTVLSWGFWAIFVAEFLLRAYIARFQKAFWKRNWWQIIFLLVPFLRFFRALQAFRLVRLTRFARFGSVISAGIRGTRSAGRLLTGRIAWLGAVTAVVVLVSSQLLYLTGSYETYGQALHEAALATITGGGIDSTSALSQFLQIVLAVYSVVVFATLAGSLGAYFLRPQPSEQ
ncbi:voltage-gated potassium channel [Paramicrobacterium agarici]|uniref:Voltage-gated potassium channel n=2 Tax=Paramicrobacterium agarici TaxID=630514 RepID=A0A2A9DXH4_9MICO|nr:voltage-gated potassium channel [Microbacterium agarici]TQO23902.1 voltage-gated potassium channel [Microbacterium agarici]